MKRYLTLAVLVLLAASCGGRHGGQDGDGAAADSLATETAGKPEKKSKATAKADTAAVAKAQNGLPQEPVFDIVTSMGTIRVKLYKNTPKHRDNFTKLALSHFYDDVLFHRVIDGFIIQGGDPFTRDTTRFEEWGEGGPGYTIDAEIRPEYTHKKGALAAARRLHRLSWKAFFLIAGCGGVLSLHWVAFYASIQASNVSVGVACIATSCFFTTLLDPLINRKRLSWAEVLISFIAIAGVLLIFSLDVRYRLGIALGLLSAALYSLFSLLNINVARVTGEDSATMLLYELIGGVILLSALVPFLPAADIVPARGDILWLVLLGSVFTIIPFLFQLIAFRTLSAFTVNLAYNLEPVYSIALAALLFHETREVGWSFWLGLTLIVLSVILQNRRVAR